MTSHLDSLPGSFRRQSAWLGFSALAGVATGLIHLREGTLAGAPWTATYLACLVTLTLCTKMARFSFATVPDEPGASVALRQLYVWTVVQVVALAWVGRTAMLLALLPFVQDLPVGAALAPLSLGLPLDVLLVTTTLTLAAALGQGGALLALALVALLGALGQEALTDPNAFGALSPVLRGLAFPWLYLKSLGPAVAAGDLGAALRVVAGVAAYGAAWVALGLGALTYRARRAAAHSGSR